MFRCSCTYRHQQYNLTADNYYLDRLSVLASDSYLFNLVCEFVSIPVPGNESAIDVFSYIFNSNHDFSEIRIETLLANCITNIRSASQNTNPNIYHLPIVGQLQATGRSLRTHPEGVYNLARLRRNKVDQLKKNEEQTSHGTD
jgi:hypothetical protein